MLVTYTYRADEPSTDTMVTSEGSPTKSTGAKGPETKTFTFYTVVDLGPIVSKEEAKTDGEL